VCSSTILFYNNEENVLFQNEMAKNISNIDPTFDIH